MNRISQGFTGAIASAVAGEITRLAAHPDFHISEGVAYKAAWDRLADAAGAPRSPVPALCDAFRRDCAIAGLVANAPRVAALYMAAGNLDLGRI